MEAISLYSYCLDYDRTIPDVRPISIRRSHSARRSEAEPCLGQASQGETSAVISVSLALEETRTEATRESANGSCHEPLGRSLSHDQIAEFPLSPPRRAHTHTQLLNTSHMLSDYVHLLPPLPELIDRFGIALYSLSNNKDVHGNNHHTLSISFPRLADHQTHSYTQHLSQTLTKETSAFYQDPKGEDLGQERGCHYKAQANKESRRYAHLQTSPPYLRSVIGCCTSTKHRT